MRKAIKIVGIGIIVTMVLVTLSPACVAATSIPEISYIRYRGGNGNDPFTPPSNDTFDPPSNDTAYRIEP